MWHDGAENPESMCPSNLCSNSSSVCLVTYLLSPLWVHFPYEDEVDMICFYPWRKAVRHRMLWTQILKKRELLPVIPEGLGPYPLPHTKLQASFFSSCPSVWWCRVLCGDGYNSPSCGLGRAGWVTGLCLSFVKALTSLYTQVRSWLLNTANKSQHNKHGGPVVLGTSDFRLSQGCLTSFLEANRTPALPKLGSEEFLMSPILSTMPHYTQWLTNGPRALGQHVFLCSEHSALLCV
jgi:hypothetical protein